MFDEYIRLASRHDVTHDTAPNPCQYAEKAARKDGLCLKVRKADVHAHDGKNGETDRVGKQHQPLVNKV